MIDLACGVIRISIKCSCLEIFDQQGNPNPIPLVLIPYLIIIEVYCMNDFSWFISPPFLSFHSLTHKVNSGTTEGTFFHEVCLLLHLLAFTPLPLVERLNSSPFRSSCWTPDPLVSPIDSWTINTQLLIHSWSSPFLNCKLRNPLIFLPQLRFPHSPRT